MGRICAQPKELLHPIQLDGEIPDPPLTIEGVRLEKLDYCQVSVGFD